MGAAPDRCVLRPRREGEVRRGQGSGCDVQQEGTMEENGIVRRKIIRSRLDEEFMDIFRYALTVVVAPMGYGKTMAVRDFLDRKAVPFLWVRMLGGLLEELGAAVRKQVPSGESRLPAAEGAAEIAEALSALAMDQELVVVLDSGHRAADPAEERLLQRLLQPLPSCIHVVWIGRQRLRLLQEGSLVSLYYRIIDKSILQLDLEEMTALAGALDRKCSPQELEWLTEYTGGWFSLVNYLLLENGHRGINRFWVARWTARILEDAAHLQLTGEACELLQILSFSREFTCAQAAAARNLPEEAVYPLLEQLATETVFLSKVDETYRIPEGVLDFLESRVPGSESEQVLLGEQNLARWYVDAGEFTRAIRLLNRRGNWEQILDILDSCTLEELNQAEQEIIRRLCRDLPFSQLARYPAAVIQMAFVLLKTEDRGLGEQLLFALKDYAAAHEYPNYTQKYILGQIELALASGEEQRLRAISLISEVQAWSQDPARLSSWIAPGLLCSFHRIKGGLLAEVEAFKSLCEEAEYRRVPVSGRCAAILQAEYCLEIGELKTAKYYALEAASQGGDQDNAFLHICVFFILARVMILEGRREEGLNLLRQLEGWNGEHEPRDAGRFTSMADICKGYLCATVGRWDQVPAWICENASQSRRLSGFSSYGYIIRAWSLTGQGAFMEFELMAREWKKHIERNDFLWAEIHYRIHRAISARELYGMQAAAEELKQAFLAALPDRVITPFVENGQALLPILSYAIEHQIIELSQPEIGRLNQMLSSFLRRKVYVSGRKNLLSRREKEILRLLEKGLNYQEIADDLVISKLTVRKHMQNIYTKLNVSDRINALIRAKEQMDS